MLAFVDVESGQTFEAIGLLLGVLGKDIVIIDILWLAYGGVCSVFLVS